MDTKDPHEQARLAELRSYDILDSPPESDYDQMTYFAARLCNTPAAIVTMVDEHRQWFKSVKGLDFNESLREFSFCSHVVTGQKSMVIPDALCDARFLINPLVIGEPGLRFYTGVPIISPRGFVLGSVAVLDFKPRTLEPAQVAGLEILAEKVMASLEIRRQQRQLDDLSRQHIASSKEHDVLDQQLKETTQRLLNSYEYISDGFCLLGVD